MASKIKNKTNRPFLRILDANYNRAKEALRVSEDFARFLLDDDKLTRKFKKCRHQVTRALLAFPVSYRLLLESRNSPEDVGRNGAIRDSSKRPVERDIMTANIRRAQEALRVLEEIAKILSPRHSGAFQKIRFSLYELERESFQKF